MNRSACRERSTSSSSSSSSSWSSSVVVRSVRIVPQARAGVVERLGRYQRICSAGLNLLVPFVDRMRPLIDLREQVVSFPPQPVITEDNLVVNIDTVIYFQVTEPRSATYEIANYIQAIEQLTVTTLRNVVGGMDLEATLTSRDQINGQLRGVLDEATGKWGVRVNRVEIKAIDPPASIKESMEQQMRADRNKRAAILTAEGVKQSADPHRRGREAVGDPHRAGRAGVGDPARRGPGEGDQHRVRRDPRGQPGPAAARLPVPRGAAEGRRRTATRWSSYRASSPPRCRRSPRASSRSELARAGSVRRRDTNGFRRVDWAARLGRVGVWTGQLDFSPADIVREAAREVEALGYRALWTGEAVGREVLSAAQLLLAATDSLVVATGIANIWARDALATAAGQLALGEAYPDRFMLGIGASHKLLLDVRGGEYQKPLAHMRSYLDGMDNGYDVYRAVQPAHRPPRLLAALGPKMLELSRERADGAHTYFVPPEHTARAREILGAGQAAGARAGLRARPTTRRSRARSPGGTPRRTCGCRTTRPTSSGSASTPTTSPTAATTGWSTRSVPGARSTRSRHGCRRTSTPAPTTSRSRSSSTTDAGCRAGVGRARAGAAGAVTGLGGHVSDFDDATAIRPRDETGVFDADLASRLGDRRQAQRRLPARDPRPGRLRRRSAPRTRSRSRGTTCGRPNAGPGARSGPRSSGRAAGSRRRGRRCGRATSRASTRSSPAASCTTCATEWSAGPPPDMPPPRGVRAAPRRRSSASSCSTTCELRLDPATAPFPTAERRARGAVLVPAARRLRCRTRCR